MLIGRFSSLVKAMPREPFIGSFMTKTWEHACVDIKIVSINPQIIFPASRLSLWCHDTFLGRVIWEAWYQPANNYVAVLGFPPFRLMTRGSMFNVPHAPQALPVLLDVGANFTFIPADWHHNCYLEFLAGNGHLRFRYWPQPTPQHPNPAPILFRRLRFIPQIQTSTKAELT